MSTAPSPHRRRLEILRNPFFYVLIASLLFVLLLVSLFSAEKTSAAFSYQQDTCKEQMTLLPGLMKQTGPSGYEVEFTDAVSIGDWPIIARQVCIVPVAAPTVGEQVIRFGLNGMAFGSRQLRLEVPEPPVVTSNDFLDQEISITQPLVIELTAPDQIHQYDLEIGNETVRCEGEGKEIQCDVTKLDLAQGKEYNSTLTRAFKDEAVAELGEGKIATLAPLKMKNSSVKVGQMRFDAPRKFELEFSRPLDETKGIKLLRHEDKERTPQQIETSTNAAKLIITSEKDLPREATYSLIVEDAIADNGSSLEKPVSIEFKTSGGPKVTGVSVGNTAVPTNARIVVTFDQPISESVDVAKIARIKGSNGTVSRASASQLAFSLSAEACKAFSLHIEKGVASGSNSAVSTEPWSFSSRAACGSSSVIGYSVQGRPIVAHYFGSGNSTILFTGGIHGNELSAQQTMQGFVDYLYANAHEVIPAGKRVVVVPNTNPDGIATGSRNNVNNVNLGRNFPTANWKADTDTPAGILKNGGGKTAGSEPETKALMNLTRQLRPRLEVSFHSQGYLVGANKVADSVAIGTIYANTVGYRTMFYDAEAIMGYSMTGEYEGWMGEEMGIPAILIELPSHYGNYFPSQQAALLKMLRV